MDVVESTGQIFAEVFELVMLEIDDRPIDFVSATLTKEPVWVIRGNRRVRGVSRWHCRMVSESYAVGPRQMRAQHLLTGLTLNGRSVIGQFGIASVNFNCIEFTSNGVVALV